MCDTKGVIYEGRTEGMNPYKARFAVEDRAPAPWPRPWSARTCSSGFRARQLRHAEMVLGMAPQPDRSSRWRTRIPKSPTTSRVRRASGRDRGHGPLRFSEPGEQRPRLPVHLPRRAGCARHHDQRRDETGRHPRAGRPWPRKTCPIPCCAPTAWSAWSSAASTSSRNRSIRACSSGKPPRWRRPPWRRGVAQQPVDIDAVPRSNWSAAWARPT